MTDPRDEYLESVDFNTITIRERPNISFLCGGDPRTFSDPTDDKTLFPSLRSYISQLLLIKQPDLRYQNAEDIKDWNSYSVYADLIEFEKDIAHICNAIILFVESEGSIAELGSFAIIPEIYEKLIVFVNKRHSKATSFISLGPLKRLYNNTPERIHYIPWSTTTRTIAGEERTIIDVSTLTRGGDWGEYVCANVKSFHDQPRRIDHFSAEYSTTIEALFIHDIACLFKAVTENELDAYFKQTNHPIDRKRLRRIIFCLEKLNLIRTIESGNKTFITPEHADASRFLSLRGGDTARLAMQVAIWYQHISQLPRRAAIEEVFGVHS